MSQWESRIIRIENGNKEVTKIQGLILFAVQMEDLQVQTWFKIMQYLVVNILLGTTYIDKYTWVRSPWNAR